MRLLMIENEDSLQENLSEAFVSQGYQVDRVSSIRSGGRLAVLRIYSAILLAESLFKKEGEQAIEALRSDHQDAVIVMVLANNGDDDGHIAALKSGADDYVRHADNVDLVTAQLKARLSTENRDLIHIEGLVINAREETVEYDGERLELTGKSFDVLLHLARHANQIVSKEQLLDALWESPELITPAVTEVAISKIRQTIDKPFGIITIETVRGRGYRFCFEGKTG